MPWPWSSMTRAQPGLESRSWNPRCWLFPLHLSSSLSSAVSSLLRGGSWGQRVTPGKWHAGNLLTCVPRLRTRKRKCGRKCNAELPTVTRQFTLTTQHKHRPQGSSASESRLTSCGSRNHNLISYTLLCYVLLCLYHIRLSLNTIIHTQVWAHTLFSFFLGCEKGNFSGWILQSMPITGFEVAFSFYHPS